VENSSSFVDTDFGKGVTSNSEDKPDYWAEVILDWYNKFSTTAYKPLLMGLVLSVPASILIFYMFVSSSFSNVVAFVAFMVSLSFIFISMGLLGWILSQPTGTRAMKEVADPI